MSTRTEQLSTTKWMLIALLSAAVSLLVIRWIRSGAATQHPVATGPNVVLIVLDTTRADYFSCYGFPRPITPRMDAFASEGARYTRAYSTSFWTLPSHATMFTGLYPSEAGATSETNHLPEAADTLAELLSTAGYKTGAVVCNGWVSRDRGFAQGFADYAEMWRGPADMNAESPPENRLAKAPQVAAEWIKRNSGGGSFFLFINFNYPHLPYSPPERIVKQRLQTAGYDPKSVDRLRQINSEWKHFAGQQPLSESDFEIIRELYAGEMAYTDECVAKVLDALVDANILDDTLVIITSDHGESLGEHDLLGHPPSMYETTMHIPLMLRFPPRFEPGTVNNDLVSLVQLVPTVLDVCDLYALMPKAVAARPSLASEDGAAMTEVLAQNEHPVNGLDILRRGFPQFDADSIDCPMRMLIDDRYKLIWHVGKRTELYDLWVDRDETQNLAEQRHEVVERMLRRLGELEKGFVRPPATGDAPDLKDQEALEQLRNYGYLD